MTSELSKESARDLSRLRVQDWVRELGHHFGEKQIKIHAAALLAERMGLHITPTCLIGPQAAKLSHLMGAVFGVSGRGTYNMVTTEGREFNWEKAASGAGDIQRHVAIIADPALASDVCVVRASLESDVPPIAYSDLIHVASGLACIYGPANLDMRTLFSGILSANKAETTVGKYFVERPGLAPGEDVKFDGTIVLEGGAIDVPQNQVGKRSANTGTVIKRSTGWFFRFRDGPVVEAFEKWKQRAIAIETDEI